MEEDHVKVKENQNKRQTKHRNISSKVTLSYHQYCGNDARGLPPSSWFWLLENTEIHLENTVI